MSIHKTPTGKHEVRWREGKRNRSRSFTLKQDAKRFELNVTRIQEMGGVVGSRHEGTTFQEFAMNWLAQKQLLSEVTRIGYLRLLDAHVFDDLGHLKLPEFNAPLIYRWQTERLRKGAGPMALRKARGIISQVLQHAKDSGFIRDNPIPGMALIERRVPKRVVTPASPRQIEELRNWMLERDRVGDATLISLLAYVGIRPQDALALEWRHISDDRARIEQKNVDGEIHAGLKTGTAKIRSVRIPAQVSTELKQWRLITQDPRLLFPHARTGKPWGKNAWNAWRRVYFNRAVASTDLPSDFRPYDLRHSAASIFIAAGWSVGEGAHQLGHSIDMFVRTYAHEVEAMRGLPPQRIEDVIADARRPQMRRAV